MWSKYDTIHPAVLEGLQRQGFHNPTQIQLQVLENYKHYFDFLLASQTGSGKTLAFGIPIISDLLYLKQQNPSQQNLSCLILTPTRELALQIDAHLKSILPPKHDLKITNIIGGLSRDKQLRLLSYRPDIIIATPGRLNELLGDEVEGLKGLDRIRYLVIDEADRMIEMGHFQEVDDILAKIFDEGIETFDKELLKMKKKNKKMQEEEEEIPEQQQQEEGGEKKKKPALFVKDKNIKLNIEEIEMDTLIELPADFFSGAGFTNNNSKKSKKAKKMEEKEQEKQEREEKIKVTEVPTEKQAPAKKKKKKNEETHVAAVPEKKPKKKIFLVSATLTREFKDTKYYTKRAGLQKIEKDNEKEKLGFDNDLSPKLKSLVSRIKFSGKPKIIDLSSNILIPQNVTEYVSYCDDEEEKLVHLVCYLEEKYLETPNAKTIIFTNTIKASNKVMGVLGLLNFKCVLMHSNMQQRQRIVKLERFTSTNKDSSKDILICTDLAARGLDMLIDCVVQYGVPLNGDTYVHRLGRTARAGRKGQNFTIVQKTEYSKWKAIVAVLNPGTTTPSYRQLLFKMSQIDEVRAKVQVATEAFLKNKAIENLRSQDKIKEQAKEADIIFEDEREGNGKTRRLLLDEPKNKANKPIKKLYLPKAQSRVEEEAKRWKKNKMVMSIGDINAYLSRMNGGK